MPPLVGLGPPRLDRPGQSSFVECDPHHDTYAMLRTGGEKLVLGTLIEPVVYRLDDIAWIGIVTCLRNAGLGIADLRRFTDLLRTGAGSQSRVAFLARRREELPERCG